MPTDWLSVALGVLVAGGLWRSIHLRLQVRTGAGRLLHVSVDIAKAAPAELTKSPIGDAPGS